MVAELIQELKKAGHRHLPDRATTSMTVMELCDRAVGDEKRSDCVGTVDVNEVTDDDLLGMIILGKKPGE